MLELLKNEIVINWIAPIITGLIVTAISAFIIYIIKVLKLRKDEKMIKEANQRYLDTIMPFIIQKIKISSEYITDVRNVIISESGLKDKYVFTELSLRNKLIMDISESKYVDENNKIELIDFTYDIFNNLENKNNLEVYEDYEMKKSNNKSKVSFTFLSNPVFLLLFSQILIVLVVIFDKRNIAIEDNVLIVLPLFLGILSIFGIVLKMLSNIFDDSISRRKNLKFTRNFIIHNDEKFHKIKNNMKNQK